MDSSDEPRTRSLRHLARSIAGGVALACAAAALLALALRPTSSVDLGYHLAYGEQFLRTGRIVQDAKFIHPPPSPTEVTAELPLPPGAWFDADGSYHFLNANWLSQALFAGLWRLGGWTAMNAALLGFVALIGALQLLLLHRLGAGWWWAAPVWLLTGLTAYERFLLRPELISYACILAQLALLVSRRMTWPKMAGFLLIQWVAVNAHSYWLLGAAVAAAMSADAWLRVLWRRYLRSGPAASNEASRRAIRLTILAGLCIPLAMAHPAGPRNAAFPLRTLGYLRSQGITDGPREDIFARLRTGDLHPWSTIAELKPPSEADRQGLLSGRSLKVALALSAIGAVLLGLQRRWGLLAVLIGFTAAGMSTRRNMGMVAFFCLPLVAVALAGAGRWLGRSSNHSASARGQGRHRPHERGWLASARLALLLLVATASGVSAWWTASDRLYLAESRYWRFGWGVSRLALPLESCRWLDENLPHRQPVFADQPISGSVVFFSEKASACELLTNTWAFPPSRMMTVLQLGAGVAPVAQLDAWGLDAAVVQVWPVNRALAANLLADPNWAAVHAEAWRLVFLRRTSANAAVIAREEFTRATFDVQAFAERCRRQDPVPVTGLRAGAEMLHTLGWFEHAEPMWRACLADPIGASWAKAWLNLGVCLAVDGRSRAKTGDPAGLGRLREARDCFFKALRLEADLASAEANLRTVEDDLRRYGGGL